MKYKIIGIFVSVVFFFLISPSSASAQSVKIMTFNILGEPVCRSTYPADLRKITDFIRNNGIVVGGLQEIISDHENGCDIDMQDVIRGYLSGTNYGSIDRLYISSGSRKWYRVFVHTTPLVSYHKTSPDVDPANSQGAESVVLDTAVGRIRFINIHPQPGIQAQTLHNMLVPYINQFKGDGIPMVIMGDFNAVFGGTNGNVLDSILQAGFYRACDPNKFPSGSCNDTIKGATNQANDHILIDNRATFFVKNAYVEQSMQFSDHLPVVVELSNALPNPTGLSYTCNGNSTATFRWNAVTGAAEYAFRLDNQGSTSNPPIYNWFTAPADRIDEITSTSITVSITAATRYQWAVTAVANPSSSHPGPTWQPEFNCTAPTPTQTPTRTPTPTPTRTPIPTATPTPLPGDTTPPRGISITELFAVFRLFYSPGDYTQGDADRNGVINSFDIRIIRSLL